MDIKNKFNDCRKKEIKRVRHTQIDVCTIWNVQASNFLLSSDAHKIGKINQ